jgi:hypothetical protein
LGVIGGLSETTQSFASSSSGQQWTNYNLRVTDPRAEGPITRDFDYQVLTDHAVQNRETQTLKGGDIGLTASLSRGGGFFSDSLVKIDPLNLNRTSTTFDTFNSVLNADRVNISGCIALNDGKVPSTSNPQTTKAVFVGSTTQRDFILADNTGYHFDLKSGYWIEPLVGFQYTYTTYGSNAADLGLTDGQALRLQGGARVGLTGFYLMAASGLDLLQGSSTATSTFMVGHNHRELFIGLCSPGPGEDQGPGHPDLKSPAVERAFHLRGGSGTSGQRLLGCRRPCRCALRVFQGGYRTEPALRAFWAPMV